MNLYSHRSALLDLLTPDYELLQIDTDGFGKAKLFEAEDIATLASRCQCWHHALEDTGNKPNATMDNGHLLRQSLILSTL